jgi:predicted Zn-dependent protease
LRLDPNLTILKIYLAKTLTKLDKYDEATIMLKEVIEEDNPSDRADWHINKEIAKKMLNKIEKKMQKKLTSPESIKSSVE